MTKEQPTETIFNYQGKKCLEKLEKWTKIGRFGSGVIFSSGDKRKIVTPDLGNFYYNVKPLEKVK